MDAGFSIEWEDVGCMLCGDRAGRPAGSVEWRGNRLTYVICQCCGLKYMSPRPTAGWYRSFYAGEFWEDKFENRSWRPGAGSWMPWHWFRGGLRGRIRKGRKRARAVAPLIAEHAGLSAGARVLDIGCAFGLILDELRRERGIEPFGIEPSEVAREHAARTYGVSFVGRAAEDLPDLDGHDGFFDLVIMSNVLENIVAPKPILQACRRVLKSDGRLYVETPNFFYYDAMNPYHPYIFSETTLSMLLAQAGLETVEALYKQPVGAPAAGDHIDRSSRARFVTVFARPGEEDGTVGGGVDADRLLEWQRASLASLAA